MGVIGGMEWLPPPPLESPASNESLRTVSFDLIRASAIARQSASFTCVALKRAREILQPDQPIAARQSLGSLFRASGCDQTSAQNGESNA